MSIREVEEKYSHPIAVLGDLQGPKLRVGEFSNPNGEMLTKGQTFRLDLDEAQGDSSRVMLPHPEIIEASEVGHVLLVDDGKVKLVVSNKGKDYLDCTVEVPGKISNRKVRLKIVQTGLKIPNMHCSTNAYTIRELIHQTRF
jgi:pyruvate kinase